MRITVYSNNQYQNKTKSFRPVANFAQPKVHFGVWIKPNEEILSNAFGMMTDFRSKINPNNWARHYMQDRLFAKGYDAIQNMSEKFMFREIRNKELNKSRLELVCDDKTLADINRQIGFTDQSLMQALVANWARENGIKPW